MGVERAGDEPRRHLEADGPVLRVAVRLSCRILGLVRSSSASCLKSLSAAFTWARVKLGFNLGEVHCQTSARMRLIHPDA